MDKKIGNWSISKEGIEWDNETEKHSYFIDSDRLLELTERSGVNMYDWLVHMPTKTWVSRKDTLDLNEAFKYLAEQLEIEIDEKIYNDTIEHQIGMIRDKE